MVVAGVKQAGGEDMGWLVFGCSIPADESVETLADAFGKVRRRVNFQHRRRVNFQNNYAEILPGWQEERLHKFTQHRLRNAVVILELNTGYINFVVRRM